jgi:hypothetical protein
MTIDLTSPTMATITFTADPGFQFIDTNIAEVNVNAATWTITGPGSNDFTQFPGFATASFTNTGSGNVDGFGVFNQTLKNVDGFDHAVQSLSFVLTDTSGTWASALNVLALNGLNGFFDAAHIAVCATTPCTQPAGASVTGFASENTLTSTTPPPIPEPTSLLLLGSGVLAAVGFVRRRMIRL